MNNHSGPIFCMFIIINNLVSVYYFPGKAKLYIIDDILSRSCCSCFSLKYYYFSKHFILPFFPFFFCDNQHFSILKYPKSLKFQWFRGLYYYSNSLNCLRIVLKPIGFINKAPNLLYNFFSWIVLYSFIALSIRSLKYYLRV